MANFTDKLGEDKFLLTVELNPPKGVDLDSVLDRAEELRDLVDAFNITDSQSSIMTVGPASIAHLLVDRGIEPILQFTGRDRNRIALQSDLLSAYVLGVRNLLCLTGDPPSSGDHPDAKAVFDLDGVTLVQAASTLTSGRDLGGKDLKGAPSFSIGAAVNPGAGDVAKEIGRMEQKVQMGATFFQSQAIFEPERFGEFMSGAAHVKAPVLAGIILLKSARMARYMNEHLPGVHVPEEMVQEMEDAEDRTQKGIEIAARIIRGVRDMARGVHIMAIGWERHIPRVLQEAGLAPGA